MLSRRLIRVKVMQALYAFFQTETPRDIYKGEKDLLNSIDKIYEAYIYSLLLLAELNDVARIALADKGLRYTDSATKADNSVLFINNKILNLIASNAELAQKAKKYKLSWQKGHDLVKQLFSKLRKTEEYKDYQEKDIVTFEEQRDFVIWLYKKFLMSDDVLTAHLEESFIYWPDDKAFVTSMLVKTIKSFEETDSAGKNLIALLKDEADDIEYTKLLFKRTISNDQQYEALISAKTENWDVERIAVTDIIIMKMCLSEIAAFSNIPVKVSINEYIDIAKEYSTPKSNVFINGVIDKIVNEWKQDGKVIKTGRGLLDS